MKRIHIAIAICGLAGWAVAAQAQETVEIIHKPLAPGQIVRTHMNTSNVGTMSGIATGRQNVSQKQDQWLKTECLDVTAEGVRTLRTTFERMAMAMTMGPIHMQFDSADGKGPASQPLANPMSQVIKAMVGKSITARFDAGNNCLEVKGFQEMMEGAFKNVPGGREMAKAFLADDADLMQQQYFGYTTWLPDRPVKIGDVWTTDTKMPMGPMGTVAMKCKHKLVGVDTADGKRIARVIMTVNMEMDNADKPLEIGGGKMNMHLTSTGGTGSWLWDLDKGQMVRMKQTSPMEMTIGGQMPAAQSQPVAKVLMTQKAVVATTMEQIEGDPN